MLSRVVVMCTEKEKNQCRSYCEQKRELLASQKSTHKAKNQLATASNATTKLPVLCCEEAAF